MMTDWLIATVAGIELGLLLYVCVRLRMFFGPRIRERYGNLMRRAFWALTLLFMVPWLASSLIVTDESGRYLQSLPPVTSRLFVFRSDRSRFQNRCWQTWQERSATHTFFATFFL